MAALVVVAGLVVGLGTQQVDGVAEDVGRVGQVFPGDESRPAQRVEGTLTFLVVGVDPSDAGTGTTRAEAALLVRLTADRQHVQLVALSPDTWVSGANSTLDEAFTAEGAQGAVRIVEELTDVRIDHYAELDYTGFATVTDALGGIDVDVPEPYTNQSYSFAPGLQEMDGARALAYVRDESSAASAGSPRRYEGVVRGLLDRMGERGAFTDLVRLADLLGSVTAALRVDDSLADEDLVATAWEFRGAAEQEFVSAPVAGTGEEDGRPVVYLDEGRAGALWQYLRDDVLVAHVSEFR